MTAMQNLLPIKFEVIKNRAFVHLIDPNTLDFSFGFLKHSIQDLPITDQVSQFMPVNVWLQAFQSDVNTLNFSHTSIIFHVARCGSTLLCQNLKATGRFITIGEPAFAPFDKLDQICPKLSNQAFKRTVHVWQEWVKNRKCRLVIKFSSTLHECYQRYSQVLPKAKLIFLYRNPLSVFESLIRKPPKYIKMDSGYAKERRLPEPQWEQTDPSLTLAAQFYCQALAKFTGHKNSNFAAILYDDLEVRFPDLLAFLLDAQNAPYGTWKKIYYSKAKPAEKTIYTPVTEKALSEFYENHRPTIDYSQLVYKKMKGDAPTYFGLTH